MDDRDCSGEDYCNFSATEGRWRCVSPNMNCVIG
jgi:hypothetical protein